MTSKCQQYETFTQTGKTENKFNKTKPSGLFIRIGGD